MLGLTTSILVLAAVLILQPLIALVWVYLFYRFIVSYTASRTGSWVDERVEKVGEELAP